MKMSIALLVVGLGVTPLGHAATKDARAVAGEVPVLSGGVGEDARAQLSEQARGYNLKVVFTLSTGAYLADIPFHVVREGKVMVDEVAAGPWVFAKLPPGSYTVSATHEGKRQTRKVAVPKTGQSAVSFVWPAPARVERQP